MANLFHPHDLHRLSRRLGDTMFATHPRGKRWNAGRFLKQIEPRMRDPELWPDEADRAMLDRLVTAPAVRAAIVATRSWLEAYDLVRDLAVIATMQCEHMSLRDLSVCVLSARSRTAIFNTLYSVVQELAEPYRSELLALAERVVRDRAAQLTVPVDAGDIFGPSGLRRGRAATKKGALRGYAVRRLMQYVGKDYAAIAKLLKACGLDVPRDTVRTIAANVTRFPT